MTALPAPSKECRLRLGNEGLHAWEGQTENTYESRADSHLITSSQGNAIAKRLMGQSNTPGSSRLRWFKIWLLFFNIGTIWQIAHQKASSALPRIDGRSRWYIYCSLSYFGTKCIYSTTKQIKTYWEGITVSTVPTIISTNFSTI